MAFDLNSIAKTLLSSDSLKSISKTTKTSSNDVTSVLAAALPLLIQGAAKQSTGAKTSDSFAEALLSHAKDSTTDLSAFMKKVDVEDGSKIISHLLGKKADTSANKIAEKTGVDTEKVIKILAVAAPLLMSLLGKKTKTESKKNTDASVAELATSLLSNVDVGSLIGTFLKK